VVRNYPNAVATVGKLQVYPGGINIIPGEVTLSLDLRDIDQSVRDQIEQEILTCAQKVSDEQGVEFQVQELQRVAPVPCAPELQKVIEQSCRKIGIEPIALPSGAGHDGMQFGKLCPVGMIFVRSQRGISHSPEEWSSPEDCEAGTQVLYHTLLELAVPVDA
jgi:allantoate deiminase